MVLEQRDKQFNSREFSTTEISLPVSRSIYGHRSKIIKQEVKLSSVVCP